MTAEYAFQGYRSGTKAIWSDAYQRLGDARRAAKQWVDGTPSRYAELMVREKSDHAFGAQWRIVGQIGWAT